MELRTEENNDMPTGLRLAGTDGEEAVNKVKTPETDVWDFSQGADTVRIATADSALKRTAKENKQVDPADIVIKVMGIVVYIATILESAILCWMAYQGVGPLMTNLHKFRGIVSFLSLLIIIDAVLVNILFEKKWSLILLTLLLPFLYPGVRNSHVKGSGGIGSLLSLLYFFCLCGFIAFIGSSYLHYGAVLAMEDESNRTIAVDALDQVTESGETLGDILSKTLVIEKVGVQQQAGNVVVGFAGRGMLSLDQDVFIKGMTKSVPTELVFVKTSSGATYELKEAVLNDKELTERGIASYWKLIAAP